MAEFAEVTRVMAVAMTRGAQFDNVSQGCVCVCVCVRDRERERNCQSGAVS